MLERVAEPTSYQAFQHFITHAPWDTEAVWRRLRRVSPARTGILILDETSFPKAGRHSVAVARQYCGALGKVANCQVAVTAASGRTSARGPWAPCCTCPRCGPAIRRGGASPAESRRSDARDGTVDRRATHARGAAAKDGEHGSRVVVRGVHESVKRSQCL
jgi:hypothetical protein